MTGIARRRWNYRVFAAAMPGDGVQEESCIEIDEA